MIIEKSKIQNPPSMELTRHRINGLAKVFKLGKVTSWTGFFEHEIKEGFFYVKFSTEKEKNLKYIFKEGNF